MSILSVAIDCHDGEEPGRRQLLAVHDLRRDLECVTFRDRRVQRPPLALSRTSPSCNPPGALTNIFGGGGRFS